ncbi:MAG TPA: hypothetical protein VJV21_02155 [Pyrinomonadaceae bacterium]|nr:hypothetical protein [Pyrinomonadaceae bacterium]
MKTKIILLIAVAVLAGVFAHRSDSTVAAAPPERYTFDSGYLIPGENQFVRITVVLGGGTHEVGQVRLRSIQATQGSCSGGICAHSVFSQTTSDPLKLTPNGGLSMDIYSGNPGNAVRGVLLSDNGNLQVNAIIVDSVTGEAGATINVMGNPPRTPPPAG